MSESDGRGLVHEETSQGDSTEGSERPVGSGRSPRRRRSERVRRSLWEFPVRFGVVTSGPN